MFGESLIFKINSSMLNFSVSAAFILMKSGYFADSLFYIVTIDGKTVKVVKK